MSDKLMTPEVQARHDFDDGLGLTACPYPHDEHINSDYMRYYCEMGRLEANAFNKVREDDMKRIIGG